MTELIKHGKQLRSWQKSTPGSPQHPYTRTDAKGALKENGNYSAKQGCSTYQMMHATITSDKRFSWQQENTQLKLCFNKNTAVECDHAVQ
ncbi:hypothetical protein T09_2138 [Trichinella sp. T9]|nr:hypothetical protein T09_2138 [Trichinella sp. T9]